VRKAAAPARQKELFKVEHFSLSSYATQEASGKFTIAGMFSDQVVIPEKAQNWPALYIALILIPLEQRFNYNLALRDDEENDLISFLMTYDNEGPVDRRERLALCVPLPQFPIDRHGNYWFEVSDGSSVVLRRCYEFVVKEPDDVMFGQLTLKVRIGKNAEAMVIE